MNALGRAGRVIVRAPSRRIVFGICVGTCIVRALFLSVPDPLSIDEVSALTASEYGTASRFMATADWAERWDIANHFRQWHILWTAPHSVWGYLFPSNGQMAYALTQASALIAMVALAGAARHLFGEPGLLFGLLATALSPLFLNYTVRALGTMPAAMWLSVALFIFTRWNGGVWTWLGGGLCFGLAFGASFGAGAPIVAMAAGLGATIVRLFLARDLVPREKVRRGVVAPILGILAAIGPLVPVELAARDAGAPYLDFLRRHTMLVLEAWPGPYGLWLRELFELDPLLQVLVMVATGYLLQTVALGRRPRILLGIGCVVGLVLLVASLAEAAPRTFASLGLFGLVAVLVGATRLLERAGPADPPADEGAAPPRPLAVFDRRSLVVAISVLVVILTIWRNLSNMPRLVFPGWPLLLLGIVGVLVRALPSGYAVAVRSVAVLGCILFVVGAGATYHAKSAHERARAYAAQHAYMTELTYQNFWGRDLATRSYGWLSTRARHDVVVFGPPATLYPASAYEEDPFKILVFRAGLRRFGLEHVLSAEAMVYASIFFEDGHARPGSAPPPGTPEVPADVRGVDADGRPFRPGTHPYRGIVLGFPARSGGGSTEMAVSFVLPAPPGGDNALGFEFMAVTPYVPAGARLTVSVFGGARALGSAGVPIVGSEGRQADASAPLHELSRPTREPFRVLQWPMSATGKQEEVRVVARLEVPPGAYSPPVSCYLRRPYIHRPEGP